MPVGAVLTGLDEERGQALIDSDPTEWAEDTGIEESPVEESPKKPNPLAEKLARSSGIASLVELPGIGDATAEKLWRAGYRTLEALLDPENREVVLDLIPRTSRKSFIDGVLAGEE